MNKKALLILVLGILGGMSFGISAMECSKEEGKEEVEPSGKLRRTGNNYQFNSINTPQPGFGFVFNDDKESQKQEWQKELEHESMYGTDESFNKLIQQIPATIYNEIVFKQSNPMTDEEHERLTQLALAPLDLDDDFWS